MTDSFSSSARTLAGAAAMLGWTPDTFWAATPEDLAILFGASATQVGESDHAGRTILTRLQEQFPDG